MINPQDLADEMYKMDTPYYDSLSQKEKHDIAYKNALAKAAKKEQASQMDSLSSILKNTQPLPQQFAGMQVPVEPDPVKRQQILNDQEQAMIAKQAAGGTFTNADMQPYMRAGLQSQNLSQGNQGNAPQQVTDQFVQAVGMGVDPNVAKTAIALEQKQPEQMKNDFETFVAGQKEQGITSPAKISENWHKLKTEETIGTGTEIAKARGEAFGNIRMYPSIDTQNNNTLAWLTPNEKAESDKTSPGRYVPASGGTQAMSKNAMINEIEFSSKQVRSALDNIDFSQSQIAKFANVLKTNDNGGAISNFLQSNIGKTLTPDEITYVTAIKNLRESAYALRVAGGAGAQSSDMMRGAIDSMVPGRTTPNKEYALKALDLFDQQVKILRTGIPDVSPRKLPDTTMSREEMIAELKRQGKLR